MKLIGTLVGLSVVRMAAEEYGPTPGISLPDLVEFVSKTYQCIQVPIAGLPIPILPQGTPIATFQNGKFETEAGSIPVSQIHFRSDGIIVSCQTTSDADKVFEDLVLKLDEELKFRISQAEKKINHVSSVVVEFSNRVERFLAALTHITGIVNDAIRTTRPDALDMQVKRIAFGYEDRTSGASLDAVERIDFLIERRALVPFSDNRFFSSAPLETGPHLEALERIEAI